MLLLPAIDLMGGEVVRLQRGDPNLKTVYSNDPVAFAKKWEALGADWLHLVDLDAAFTGKCANLDAVRAICGAVSIPCELGGGMRSAEVLREAFDAGVRRVIMGTKASQSLGFVTEMAAEFGSDRLAVGIDARNGRVAIKGWQEETSQSAAELAVAAQAAG
ncbi:MAG TPA: 1-(5-phosphoribosyl)-5-[(5-phosphoribosylamino)methylideneamino] imidazole-4-carboxamide isomerase, partial [Chthoniobacterales bacterium]